jgi:aquaporin rerated protein, other eukaryote
MYPHNTKSSFTFPRTPPAAPRYDPPRFEKHDRSPSIGGNGYALWISHPVRNHLIAMLGEFVGTTFFLFFGLAAAQIANGKPDTLARVGSLTAPSLLQLLFISAGFGVGLAVNVWIFFRVSGGQFNPAV